MATLNKLTRVIVAKNQLRSILSSNLSQNEQLQLNRKIDRKLEQTCVLKEAEKVVGYPTSFLSLRWILNDNIANVASHIRKLIGTNHPLLKNLKNLIVQSNLPTWGLIVLLVSKMAGHDSKLTNLERDTIADILHSQRIFAEVTEMLKTATIIHKGILVIEPKDEKANILNNGNKLALLFGDYLLSLCCHEVANLKNYKVQEVMSAILRDIAESEFVGDRTQTNEAVPTKPLPQQVKNIPIPMELSDKPFKISHILGHMKAEWIVRNVLAGGSLLAKSCQGTLILANHGDEMQKNGYKFGQSLALAWQAALENSLFKQGKFKLVSAPIMMHLEDNPELYNEIEKGVHSKQDINYDLIRKEVALAGLGMEKTRHLQTEFIQVAMKALDEFPENESKRALVNIMKAM